MKNRKKNLRFSFMILLFFLKIFLMIRDGQNLRNPRSNILIISFGNLYYTVSYNRKIFTMIKKILILRLDRSLPKRIYRFLSTGIF